MPTCPYCGEPQNALKNHVRLSSGGGHGPSGAYPDDFDAGGAASTGDTTAPGDRGGESPSGHDDGGVPASDGAGGGDAIVMEPDELDQVIRDVEEEASTAGFETGYATAENNLTPDNPCPECGQEMPGIPPGGKFVVSKGLVRAKWFEVESGAFICEECDVLKQGGLFYYGHLSADPGRVTDSP